LPPRDRLETGFLLAFDEYHFYFCVGYHGVGFFF
jgi:hypothetical protein